MHNSHAALIILPCPRWPTFHEGSTAQVSLPQRHKTTGKTPNGKPQHTLVGGWTNPPSKNIRQSKRVSSFPNKSGWKGKKNICNHHPVQVWFRWLPSLKLTAKAPENRPFAPKKETIIFQPSIFRCELFGSGRVPFSNRFQVPQFHSFRGNKISTTWILVSSWEGFWKKPPIWVTIFYKLVVSTHLKNISQFGSFSQVGLNIKIIWLKPPPMYAILEVQHNWKGWCQIPRYEHLESQSSFIQTQMGWYDWFQQYHLLLIVIKPFGFFFEQLKSWTKSSSNLVVFKATTKNIPT